MRSKYDNSLHPSEVLLSNIVDDAFRDLFKPLHLLTSVFFLRKFHLHGNIVTPNTKRDLLTCAMGMLIVYLLMVYTLYCFAIVFESRLVFVMYCITYLQYAINYTGLCILNIFESQLNVDILLNLYKIDKKLYNKNDDRNVRNLSWILTGVLVITYCLLALFKSWLDPLWNWSRVLFITTTLIFDLELLYIVFIISLLAHKIETWRQVLKAKRIKPKNKTSIEKEELELNEMFSVFRIILNTLEFTKRVPKYVILFHFVVSFTQSLTYVIILTLWIKDKTMDPVVTSSHLFGVVLWVTKSSLTEAILCVTCEILYCRIAAARVEVILYFAHHPLCTVRRFKKNIFRLCDIRLEKLSPWGIFSVDAALPLRMAALLTNYIVVLLQFTFASTPP